MHANRMGYFVDAIEPDSEHEYAVCECGDIKQPDSHLCMRCAALVRSQAEERKWRERAIPLRQNAHAFYREKMAQGWTIADVRRHAAAERKRRGDPVKPRFWSSKSILAG